MAKQNPSRRTDPDMLSRLFNQMVLSWRLMFDRRVGGLSKLIPLAVIAYILSPIDIVPDFLLPFGIVDDVSALLIGLQLFIHSAPPGVVEEYRRGWRKAKRGAPEEVDEGYVGRKAKRGSAPDVIEGQYEVRED